jgi:hypothetical protein
MNFPLSFWDISFWLAVTAVVLLVASELIAPYWGKANILINKKRLKNAALAVSSLFLATVAVRILSMILTL